MLWGARTGRSSRRCCSRRTHPGAAPTAAAAAIMTIMHQLRHQLRRPRAAAEGGGRRRRPRRAIKSLDRIKIQKKGLYRIKIQKKNQNQNQKKKKKKASGGSGATHLADHALCLVRADRPRRVPGAGLGDVVVADRYPAHPGLRGRGGRRRQCLQPSARLSFR